MQNYSKIAMAGLVISIGACGVEGQAPVGQIDQDLNSVNGLSINGLSINGLSINGLSINGLSINGLSTTTFSTWFNQSPDTTPTVMKYIVKCALPAGKSLSWTNRSTRKAYTWPGELGLAPTWASGRPATTTEQQLITACLGAHANKYGLHIQISVDGLNSQGVEVGVTAEELAAYSVKEGCFFGNLFTGEGIFAGSASILRPSNSSPRACALDIPSLTSGDEECPPIVGVGQCNDICTLDPSGTYYTSCTYKGKSYRPLITRIQPQDVYNCGDGICQFTESCGSGRIAKNCGTDCGPCSKD